MSDYNWVTNEMFDTKLREILDRGAASDLLSVGDDVYSDIREAFNNEVLAELESERPESLICPNCGRSERIQWEETVPRIFRGLKIQDGTLMIDTNTDDVAWDGSEAENKPLFCQDCGHSWEVPDGLKVDFV